jgi:hypothetical protein
MAIQLTINDVSIPLTADAYKLKRSYVDTTNTTEAGTTVRQLARGGINGLDIEITCDNYTLANLLALEALPSVSVNFWDEALNILRTGWTAYISDFSADLITELPTERLYKVSFALNDLSAA